MKGNQMGILAAYPTQRELQLSNWTWFKRRPASGASAARPTVRIAPAVRRSCKASGEERSIVCALHHATGFLLDDLTFVVSPFWVISTMTPSEICDPMRTQAACTCARPSEVWALCPCQPPSGTDRAGPHAGAAPAAP